MEGLVPDRDLPGRLAQYILKYTEMQSETTQLSRQSAQVASPAPAAAGQTTPLPLGGEPVGWQSRLNQSGFAGLDQKAPAWHEWNPNPAGQANAEEIAIGVQARLEQQAGPTTTDMARPVSELPMELRRSPTYEEAASLPRRRQIFEAAGIGDQVSIVDDDQPTTAVATCRHLEHPVQFIECPNTVEGRAA